MNEILEPQTPPQGSPAPEPTVQTTPVVPTEQEKELSRKLADTIAQKEHWKEKYERDITNAPLPTNEPAPSEDIFSDEGKLLKQQIDAQNEKITRLEEEKQIERLQFQYPALKDKASEFEKFKSDYPRHKLENVAKLFLVENGLLVAQPERQGLEPAGGGGRQPVQTTKMAVEDVARLRSENPRKYEQMILSGQIKASDIG